MVDRYYAQYQQTAFDQPILAPDIEEVNAWCVFDREYMDPQGGHPPISACRNKATAFHIRDLLNKEEDNAIKSGNLPEMS